MKKFSTLFLIVLMAVFLTGCDSSGSSASDSQDDSLSLNILPGQLSVTVPDSLQQTAAGGISRTAEGVTSYAYDEITNSVQMMKDNNATLLLFALLTDYIVGDSNISSATQNSTLTFTQAFVDKMIELDPYKDDSVADVYQNLVGLELAVSFVYNTSTDIGYDYYCKILSLSIKGDDGDMGTTTLYFRSDKSALKLEMIDTDYSSTIIYDDNTKLSSNVFEFTFDVYTFRGEISLKEDSSSSANGVFLTFKYNSEDSTFGRTSYSADGYADDNGGYLETKFSYADVSNTSFVYQYKEGFNGSGTVTFSSYYDDTNSTWVDQGVLDTTYSDIYDTSYTPVTATLAGAAVDDIYMISRSALTTAEITSVNNYDYVEKIIGEAYCFTAHTVDVYAYEPGGTISGSIYLYKVDLSDWTITDSPQTATF